MGRPWYDTSKLDWVIVGGESGPGARPAHLSWARALRDQFNNANVPFFFKQWGEWEHVEFLDDGGERFEKAGEKKAGRILDGRTWNEMPN